MQHSPFAMDELNRDLNLKDILVDHEISRMRNKNGFDLHGLYCFTGAQGAGKTLNLIHTLLAIRNEYPNVTVVSNIHLSNVEYIPYTGIEDFDRYSRDGIVYVIDEIQTLFCSLESKKMPPETLAIWCQNRKNKRVILSTSQRFNRVAKGIREQVRYHIDCGPKILCFYRYRVIDATLYDENGQLPSDYKMPRYRLYVPKWHAFFSYNTDEVVKNIQKLERSKND